jgi:hypothetical protein
MKIPRGFGLLTRDSAAQALPAATGFLNRRAPGKDSFPMRDFISVHLG